VTLKMTIRPDEHTDYLNLILRSERWIGLPAKWVLLAFGIFATNLPQKVHIFPFLTAGVLAYGLCSLVFTLLFGFRADSIRRVGRAVCLTSYATDIAFASQVAYYGGAVSSDLHFLYVLLALKSVIYYPLWRDALLFPLAMGPLYAVLLRLSLGSWRFLTESFFLHRYALLATIVLAVLYLGWMNERSHLLEASLRRSLAERNLDLDNKTRTMQQMASSLGNRVLELRTLQEGIKAINSALALEDVLRLIVANASQVLEGARCSVALLVEGEVMSTATAMGKVGGPDGAVEDAVALAPSNGRAEFDKDIVRWMSENRKPLLRGDIRRDSRFAYAAELPISSVISMPLFMDNKVIGALIATSPKREVFTIEDSNLLSAFADQAGVAVKNARLYEQLIQEQRETERIYQHVEERRNELEAILRGIGDGVIVADPELNLLLMNPVATRIFHVRPDVTSSMPLSQVIPHQELTSLLLDALHGAEEATVKEVSMPSDDNKSETIYQALASPILGADGKPRGVVTVLRDVTSQKELERMKSSFLSVVSHELRTPLHSIKGFVDIILMGKTGPISDTQADFLRTVREQTTHLQNLINDLLEFSRLESGQVKLRLTDVSLAEVAAAVMDKLKPLADQGQVALVNHIASDIPTIQADRLRVEQVLTNLLDNAIKFTPASGMVTMTAADMGSDVQVAVSDTGIGIPANELERIFDRFYQVDSGSTRPYRGTGLGLTICKHIVEHHHGRIWAESPAAGQDKGSTFYFVLPKQIISKDDQLLLDFLTLPGKEQRQRRPRKGS
jgi:NtrC-family two-component system sensor histidine kinase KinB